MKTILFVLGSFFCCLLLCAAFGDCSHVTPAPTPAVDAGPSPTPSIYAEACANLAGLGCWEGIDDTCTSTMQKDDGKVVDIKVSCLAAAKTVGDVQACGTVACTASPDAKVPATCAVACANVIRFGCPEGPSCLTTCTKTQGKVVDLKLACLATAKTKASLQACKTVTCK